jgi:hypothetical protein
MTILPLHTITRIYTPLRGNLEDTNIPIECTRIYRSLASLRRKLRTRSHCVFPASKFEFDPPVVFFPKLRGKGGLTAPGRWEQVGAHKQYPLFSIKFLFCKYRVLKGGEHNTQIVEELLMYKLLTTYCC